MINIHQMINMHYIADCYIYVAVVLSYLFNTTTTVTTITRTMTARAPPTAPPITASDTGEPEIRRYWC